MRERLVDRAARFAAVTVAGILVYGCTSASPSTATPPPPSIAMTPSAATPSEAPSGEPWAADLAYLDQRVRATHPGPFTIHPESEWLAKINELEGSLPHTTDAD